MPLPYLAGATFEIDFFDTGASVDVTGDVYTYWLRTGTEYAKGVASDLPLEGARGVVQLLNRDNKYDRRRYGSPYTTAQLSKPHRFRMRINGHSVLWAWVEPPLSIDHEYRDVVDFHVYSETQRNLDLVFRYDIAENQTAVSFLDALLAGMGTTKHSRSVVSSILMGAQSVDMTYRRALQEYANFIGGYVVEHPSGSILALSALETNNTAPRVIDTTFSYILRNGYKDINDLGKIRNKGLVVHYGDDATTRDRLNARTASKKGRVSFTSGATSGQAFSGSVTIPASNTATNIRNVKVTGSIYGTGTAVTNIGYRTVTDGIAGYYSATPYNISHSLSGSNIIVSFSVNWSAQNIRETISWIPAATLAAARRWEALGGTVSLTPTTYTATTGATPSGSSFQFTAEVTYDVSSTEQVPATQKENWYVNDASVALYGERELETPPWFSESDASSPANTHVARWIDAISMPQTFVELKLPFAQPTETSSNLLRDLRAGDICHVVVEDTEQHHLINHRMFLLGIEYRGGQKRMGEARLGLVEIPRQQVVGQFVLDQSDLDGSDTIG